VGPSEDDETFLLWGDSHAGALGPLVEHEALTHNYAGALAFRPACAPVLQVRYSSSRFDTRFEPCDGFRDSVLDYVASHHIKNIFLHARWGWYTEEPETAPNSGPERKLAEFERLLRITLGELRRRGLNVVIIASVPEPGLDVPTALSRHALSGLPEEVAPRFSDFMRRQNPTLEALRRAADEYSVPVVYPHRILCDTVTCMVVKDGWSLYQDDSHLSTHGALAVAPMLAGYLGE